MFWRFGFHSATSIDTLLEKEGVTLLDLFEDEDLLQECKSHNTKLTDFAKQPLGESAADRSKRYKYAYYACEVLCSEATAICETFVSNLSLLDELWSLIYQPESMDLAIAIYFSKTNIYLLEKKPGPMFSFLKEKKGVIDNLIAHLSHSPISELILKFISLNDVPEALGIVDWLRDENLILQLVHQLSPTFEVETHNIAAQVLLDVIAVSYQNSIQYEQSQPGDIDHLQASQISGNVLIDQLKSLLVDFMLDKSCATSSLLTNGINIIIELIRRYCSEIEQTEYQQHNIKMTQPLSQLGVIPLFTEKFKALSTDLVDLLKVLGKRLEFFTELLANPRSVVYLLINLNKKTPVVTTIGSQLPLGVERLKICELFAEILHLQYLYTSSTLFDRLVAAFDQLENSNDSSSIPQFPNVSDELIDVSSYFVSCRVLPLCLIFKDGRLTERITEAQRLNDFQVEQQRGVRLGFMGHITYISEEVCKLVDKCSADFNDDLGAYFCDESWEEYKIGIFRETKERDRQPLGGFRPNSTNNAPGGLGTDEVEPSIRKDTSKFLGAGIESEDEEDEIEIITGSVFHNDGDVANDQFARYLCQQIVNDFPTSFEYSATLTEEAEELPEGWVDDEILISESKPRLSTNSESF